MSWTRAGRWAIRSREKVWPIWMTRLACLASISLRISASRVIRATTVKFGEPSKRAISDRDARPESSL